LIRGIEDQEVFTDNDDRENFLNRLSALLSETGTLCYAWALLPSHAHFLFKSGSLTPLPTLMMRLLTGYVVSFNHRHGRRGRLFRNRYKSIVFQEDVYLRELVRYIHLTPLWSGLVSGLQELENYHYSGHGILMGTVQGRWQHMDFVLDRFGSTRKTAREAYFSYVEAGLNRNLPTDLIGFGLLRNLGDRSPLQASRPKWEGQVKTDERILGDSGFADEIFPRAAKRHEHHNNLLRQGYDLNRLIEGIGRIFRMQPDEIVSKGKQKKKVLARSLLCYWAVNGLGLSLTELAGRLGMSVPGVGYAAKRGETIARSNHYQLPLQRHLL
jgi:hypothetical protein